jgi:hypothetical protein
MTTEITSIGRGEHLLHIGPHKTGSTAIQVALFEARDRLAELGVYYPGQKRRRREASEELFAAVRDGDGSRPTPAWDALAAEVAGAGRLRVCVSDELFGKGTPAQAQRVVEDLGGERPHVVAVARVYDRYLPSQWQERVKAGVSWSYDDWLRVVLDPESQDWERRNVWHAHDTRALVERWTTLVDPRRFTLIVADETDRQQLPTVFEALLGLPPGILEAKPGRSNESLSLEQVELLRAVDRRLLDERLAPADHRRLVKRAVREVRARVPRRGPTRPATPPWANELIVARSAQRVDFLKSATVNVVGDPEWLLGTPGGAGNMDDEPVRPSAAQVSEVVSALLSGPRQKV